MRIIRQPANVYRGILWGLQVFMGGFLIVLISVYAGDAKMTDSNVPKKKYVILIGASVGKAWNISELPKRLRNDSYSFEYVGLYQFDKSSALELILNPEENRPDAVIIKECAAYFPQDVVFDEAKSLMRRWVEQCQKRGIVPIPATVVPVTRSLDEKSKTKNPIKRIVKGILGIAMKTRMEAIIEYNDWIKEFSQKEGLAILDLEATLRISSTDRFLRDELTSGDGLHLNAEAYKLLDSVVIPTLQRIKFQK